jgi:hypothetical protein
VSSAIDWIHKVACDDRGSSGSFGDDFLAVAEAVAEEVAAVISRVFPSHLTCLPTTTVMRPNSSWWSPSMRSGFGIMNEDLETTNTMHFLSVWIRMDVQRSISLIGVLGRVSRTVNGRASMLESDFEMNIHRFFLSKRILPPRWHTYDGDVIYSGGNLEMARFSALEPDAREINHCMGKVDINWRGNFIIFYYFSAYCIIFNLFFGPKVMNR